MPYFNNAKKSNILFWSIVGHLPAAFISHGIIKTAEKIVESHSGSIDKPDQYNKSIAKNNRFKP